MRHMFEHPGVVPANTHGSEDEKPLEKFLNGRQTMNHGIGGSSLFVHSGRPPVVSPPPAALDVAITGHPCRWTNCPFATANSATPEKTQHTPPMPERIPTESTSHRRQRRILAGCSNKVHITPRREQIRSKLLFERRSYPSFTGHPSTRPFPTWRKADPPSVSLVWRLEPANPSPTPDSQDAGTGHIGETSHPRSRAVPPDSIQM